MTSRTISIAAGASVLGGVLLIGHAMAQAPAAAPAAGAAAGAAPAAAAPGARGGGGGGRGAATVTTPIPPVPLVPLVARPPITPPDYTNSIGMDFMRIRAGTMIAGAYEPCEVVPPAPVDPAAAAAAPAAGGGRGANGAAAPAGGRGAAPAAAAAPAPARAPDLSPLPPVIPVRISCPTVGTGSGWSPEQYAKADELLRQATIPGFVVTLKKPYYMGRYEVTQGEWKKVMGNNPSIFQGSKVTDDPDRHPVDSVTWADAQAFVKKLNQMEKTTAYRLPTEMEWEWAARAGQFRAPSIQPGAAGPGEATMAYGSVFQGPTAPVGTKAPNAFGLYDVIGNVWEWVNDFYNEKIVPDKIPPASGKEHVLKGGSYMAHVNALGSAIHGGGPGEPFVTGFRIVKDIS